MTDENPTVQLDSARKNGTLPKLLLIGGAALFLVILLAVLAPGGSGQRPNTGQRSDNGPQAKPQDTAAASLVEDGDAVGIRLDGEDEASMLAMQTRLSAQDEEISRLRDELQRMRAEFKTRSESQYRDLLRQINELSALLARSIDDRTDKDYRRDLAEGAQPAPAPERPAAPDLPPPPAEVLAPPPSPYGDDYILLGNPRAAVGGEADDGMVSSASEDSAPSLLERARLAQQKLVSGFGAGGPGTDGGAPPGPPPAAAAPSGRPAPSPSPSARDTGAADEGEQIVVPPGSFAVVTNLHGVDCPITSAVGGLLKGTNSSAPVILPIKGEFYGPNGKIVAEIGHAHLIGTCQGMRATRRARIKIERISFVGPDGKTQYTDADGYIADDTDGSMDVIGTLIEVSPQELAQSSIAAALEAIGNIVRQQQFVSSVGVATGVSTSTLTGDVGRAAAAAAVSEPAKRWSQFLLDQIKSNIPVIRVAPGRPLRFYTLAPITVQLSQSEVVDESQDEEPLL